MTAVAPPPNFHSVSRSWNGSAQNPMTSDEVARMFMPRSKASQRSSSTSSSPASDGGAGGWGNSAPKRKGSTRSGAAAGGWPAKPEVGRASGGSLGNSHSGSSANSGGAIHQPMPILPSQHLMSGPSQQNGGQGVPSYLILLPLNGTFERKFIQVPYFPETLRIGRQTNAKTLPTNSNGYFDSKVLSRQHAEVWADKASGRVWIRDVKSSNGTFVNGQRLSQENRDSEPHELRAEDVLELGIDIVGEDNKTIVHHKVAARVEHAGMQGAQVGNYELSLGDIDPTFGSLMSSPFQLGSSLNGLRNRSGSQGSQRSVLNGATGINQRTTPLMVAPVTMEMLVKKLNYELQAARQQSQDLQRTSEFFDALLTPPPSGPPPSGPPPACPPKLKAEETLQVLSARPSSDNLPPPPALISESDSLSLPSPLSQKPVRQPAGHSPTIPALDNILSVPPRSKTEKSSAKIPDPPKQTISLIDTLAKVRKDLEVKTAHVKDLEDALKKERIARELAEDRAEKLESASRALRAPPGPDDDDDDDDDDAGRENPEWEEDIHEITDGYASETETIVVAEPEPKTIDDDDDDDDGNDENIKPGSEADQPADVVVVGATEASRILQQRVEEMMVELHAARREIESYKRCTLAAEAKGASCRSTLAEMVESIRREEDQRKLLSRSECACQTETPPSMKSSAVQTTTTTTIENTEVEEEAADNNTETEAETTITENNFNNNQTEPKTKNHVVTRCKETSSSSSSSASLVISRRDAAPYASILGIMLLGVGLMAVLNGWQKGEKP